MKFKANWGTGIVITYAIFVICMVSFAIHVSGFKYDLVSQDYYDKAVNFQQQIDAENASLDIAESVFISWHQQSGSIQLLLNGCPSQQGSISFYKPDNAAMDFAVNFKTDQGGVATVPKKRMAHGFWNIAVKWKSGEKDYFVSKKLFVE